VAKVKRNQIESKHSHLAGQHSDGKTRFIQQPARQRKAMGKKHLDVLSSHSNGKQEPSEFLENLQLDKLLSIHSTPEHPFIHS